jgi:hypothetical protein
MKQHRDDKKSSTLSTSQSDNTAEMTEQEIKNALNYNQKDKLNALLNLLGAHPSQSTHILTVVMSDKELSTVVFQSIDDLGKIKEKHPQLIRTLIEHLLSNPELLKSIIKKTPAKTDVYAFFTPSNKTTDSCMDRTNENKLVESIKQNPGIITTTKDFLDLAVCLPDITEIVTNDVTYQRLIQNFPNIMAAYSQDEPSKEDNSPTSRRTRSQRKENPISESIRKLILNTHTLFIRLFDDDYISLEQFICDEYYSSPLTLENILKEHSDSYKTILTKYLKTESYFKKYILSFRKIVELHEYLPETANYYTTLLEKDENFESFFLKEGNSMPRLNTFPQFKRFVLSKLRDKKNQKILINFTGHAFHTIHCTLGRWGDEGLKLYQEVMNNHTHFERIIAESADMLIFGYHQELIPFAKITFDLLIKTPNHFKRIFRYDDNFEYLKKNVCYLQPKGFQSQDISDSNIFHTKTTSPAPHIAEVFAQSSLEDAKKFMKNRDQLRLQTIIIYRDSLKNKSSFANLPDAVLMIMLSMVADPVLNNKQIVRVFNEGKTRVIQKKAALDKLRLQTIIIYLAFLKKQSLLSTLPEALLQIIVTMAADPVLNNKQIARVFDEARARATQKTTALVKTKPIDGLTQGMNSVSLS